MSEDDAVEIDVEAADDADTTDRDAETGPAATAESTGVTGESSGPNAESSGADAESSGADAESTDATTEASNTAAKTTDSGSQDAVEGEATEPDEKPTDDGLAARIANVDEELAVDVADLEDRVAELEAELESKSAEVEDLTDRLKRKQADFENYKQRQKKKRQQIKDRAAEDLVERMVDVRDNLLRALDQEEGTDIRPGVETTLEEFDRVLDSENVDPIEPSPGEEVDPMRHQVMLRVESDQPEGTINELYQPGYEMGDRVIREAQVTVSDGSGDDSGE